MKRNILFGFIALVAGSLLAADSTPKDDVKAAAKKLAEKDNYSWKTTVTVPSDAPFHPGPTEGKTEKGGFTWLSMSMGDNTTEAVLKGGKGALKTDGGWKSLSEAAAGGGEGGFDPTQFLARMLQSYKAPTAEAGELADKVKDLKLADGVYAGDLTEEGAKQFLTFRRGGGAGGPEVSNAKGSARFWIKEGVLTKYEYKVKGTVSFNGNDMDVDRTTTVEIKDVGATKVTVPDEAAKNAA
jgi:hypothetical protein